MPHNDFERPALKRRRINNESSVSRIENYQHRHDPYGCSSTEILEPPALAPNGVSVHRHARLQYEQFDSSRAVPTSLHDVSLNLQHQYASLHTLALPRPSASAIETPLPSYPDGLEHFPGRDIQLNKCLPGTSKPKINSAPTLDVTIIDSEEYMVVCFGMVNQTSFVGVLCR